MSTNHLRYPSDVPVGLIYFDSELRGFQLSPTASCNTTYSIYYYKLSLGVSPSRPSGDEGKICIWTLRQKRCRSASRRRHDRHGHQGSGALRDGAAEDVAAATTLTFPFAIVLVDIRGVDAASVVRLVGEVALGVSGPREDSGGF